MTVSWSKGFRKMLLAIINGEISIEMGDGSGIDSGYGNAGIVFSSSRNRLIGNRGLSKHEKILDLMIKTDDNEESSDVDISKISSSDPLSYLR